MNIDWKLIINLLMSYFKSHIKTIIMYIIFVLIFLVVFSLYSLEFDAILYCFILSGSLSFLFSFYDFFKYFKKHKLLYNLKNQIIFSLDNLPEANNLIEKDYQKLIHILYDDKVNLSSEADIKQTEMIDYYTMWVHQIKTPISAMRLMVQSQDLYYKSELLSELFKIEQYVEMVLQYLRLYSISSDLVFEKYNLYEIVKQAIKKYSIVFIQKKIALDLKNLDVLVITDEKWILFVIEQIISNALKYTHEGTISIYMDSNSSKTLVIEDTGIGIQQNDLPRIFEKGFTGYNGRIDKKSTGIGLYLCKRIITKLSHSISITSQVSVGTKVKLDFSVSNIPIE